MKALLKKLAFKLYQAINPQNLKKSSSLEREPVNRPTIIKLALIYLLVLAGNIYIHFVPNLILALLLSLCGWIYVLIYVPISFLRKPGCSRFFTRIVPAIICITVYLEIDNSQLEYWWRASEFERDVVATQAKNPSVKYVEWSSWLPLNAIFGKKYFYVLDDSQPFIDKNYDSCTDKVEKLGERYYAVTCYMGL